MAISGRTENKTPPESRPGEFCYLLNSRISILKTNNGGDRPSTELRNYTELSLLTPLNTLMFNLGLVEQTGNHVRINAHGPGLDLLIAVALP